MAIGVSDPVELSAEVELSIAHEINSNSGSEVFFKLLLHVGVSREVDEVVDVNGKVKGSTSGDDVVTNKETIFVFGRSEANTEQLISEKMVPMARRSFEAIKCFLESPIRIRFGKRAVWGGTDDRRFILRQNGVTKSILAIGLLQRSAVANSKSSHEANDGLRHDGCTGA
jgi:hypothetical protein